MVWRKKKDAEDLFSRVDHYGFAKLAHLIDFYYLFLYFFTFKLLQSKQTGPGDRKGKKNKRQVGEEANTKKKNRGKEGQREKTLNQLLGKKEEKEQKENNNQDKHKLQ